MAQPYDFDYRRGALYERSHGRQPLSGYGRDYGAHDLDAGGDGWRRRRGRRGRLVWRTDRRAGAGMWQGRERGWTLARDPAEDLLHGQPRRGYPGAFSRWYRRLEDYPRGERRWRDVPADWRRYLSREEYGLGPGGAYDREYTGDRFRRGPLGARNALFGGQGFVRYDREYDDQWW